MEDARSMQFCSTVFNEFASSFYPFEVGESNFNAVESLRQCEKVLFPR